MENDMIDTYASVAGRRINLAKPDEDHVTFFPEGGGFQQSMPLSKFLGEFTKVEGPPPYYAGTVTADWLEDMVAVPCYTNGRLWNGWGTPCFTLEQVKDLVVRMKAPLSLGQEEVVRILDDGTVEEYDENEEVWLIADPDEIEVDGVKLVVYLIGDGWCWDSVKPLTGSQG
jgi:hypothetical protein